MALAVLGVSLLPSLASAQPLSTVYLGGGIGKSELRDVSDVEADVAKLYGGVQLSDNLAFETEWIGMDDFDIDGFALDDVETDTVNLSVVFSHSLSERFSLLAKGGVHYTELDFSGGDSENSGASLGLGASYDINPAFGIRAEYQRLYNATDFNEDFELYSVGVRFRF